jgi:hypothetical protein
MTKGFGSIYLTKLGVGVVLGYAMNNVIFQRKYLNVFFVLSLCLTAYLQWPLVHLWGFWVCLIFSIYSIRDPVAIAVSSSLLGIWLLQESAIGSWTAVPYVSLIVFPAIYFVSMWVGRPIFFGLLIACLLVTGYQVFELATSNPRVEISHDKTILPSYSPGFMLAKILNGSIVDPGKVAGDIGISSVIFDKGPYRGSKHILLAEHDIQPPENDPVLRCSNAQQSEPWYSNQFFGNQYLLEAVARDGFWAGNLGGSLNANGRLLLGSLTHHGDQLVAPLVVQYDRYIYVQDSDSFVDRLANRQENIVKEISIGRIFPRILNIFFCIIIFFDLTTLGLLIRLTSVVVMLGCLGVPRSGDVRIVGNIDWPHEPSKASGVMTSLIDSGYPFLLGDTNARILVVGSGMFAVRKSTETLVILEPGASVRIDRWLVCAKNDPIGNREGIVDCRNLLLDDQEVGPEIQIGDVTIVGTGSPSKINWERRLES